MTCELDDFFAVESLPHSRIAVYLLTTQSPLDAQKSAPVKIKAADIGGVVSTGKGPEAGVWVIAETTELALLATSKRWSLTIADAS